MIKLYPSTKIYLAQSTIPKAGLGVFSHTNINKSDEIETAPVLVLPIKDYPKAKKTILRNYYFMWGTRTAALCYGFGSFYNHSYQPNATYQKNTQQKTITFTAIKKIPKNTEITINYNYGDPDSKKMLWIKAIQPTQDIPES